MAPTTTHCAACGELATGKAKLFPCTRCNRFYHNACQPSCFTRDRTCSPCQVAITSAKRASAAIANSGSRRSSFNSTSSATGSATTTLTTKLDAASALTESPSPSSPNINITEDPLTTKLIDQLMSKMEVLLDSKLSSGFKSVLDKISVNTQEISEMKKEQAAINDRLSALENSRGASSSSELAAFDTGLSQSLPHTNTGNLRLNATIASQVTSIVARQQSCSTSIVIGGVPLPASMQLDSLDLRRLSLAVLRSLDSGLVDREVISARFIGTPGPRTHRNTNSNSTEQTTSEPVVSVSDDPGRLPVGANKEERPRPILVVLHSSSLVSELIRAKIRKRRLTMGDLDADLLGNAGYPLPLLEPALSTSVNVNEYLPPEVHRLLTVVRRKGASGDKDLQVFVRSGQIYVRWKGNTKPTIINSVEDFNLFLELKKKET